MAQSKMHAAYTYAGPGASSLCVALTLRVLRSCLPPAVAVRILKPVDVASKAWTEDADVIVMPGGYGRGYVSSLRGPLGSDTIRSFVERGGAYLGLCAGAYYGSSRTIFERNDPNMGVVGRRPLGFFDGDAVGSITPRKFVYGSELGASGVRITLSRHFVRRCRVSGERTPDEEPLHVPGSPVELEVYANGGCCFVPQLNDVTYEGGSCAVGEFPKTCEVLATYSEGQGLRNNGEGKAAIVSCKVGEGRAILCGVHPEFTANDARNAAETSHCEGAVLQDHDDLFRLALFRSLLREAGVEVEDVVESITTRPYI